MQTREREVPEAQSKLTVSATQAWSLYVQLLGPALMADPARIGSPLLKVALLLQLESSLPATQALCNPTQYYPDCCLLTSLHIYLSMLLYATVTASSCEAAFGAVGP